MLNLRFIESCMIIFRCNFDIFDWLINKGVFFIIWIFYTYILLNIDLLSLKLINFESYFILLVTPVQLFLGKSSCFFILFLIHVLVFWILNCWAIEEGLYLAARGGLCALLLCFTSPIVAFLKYGTSIN